MKYMKSGSIIAMTAVLLLGFLGKYLCRVDSIEQEEEKKKIKKKEKEDLDLQQPEAIKKDITTKSSKLDLDQFSLLDIQKGFQLIAKDLLEKDFKRSAIKTLDIFLELFVRKASLIYMSDNEALEKIPKNKEEMIDFILSSGLQSEYRKICQIN